MQEILEAIARFFVDSRLHILLLLIVADLVVGVAEAIANKEFEWRRLADFYRTKVVPYVLGYLVLYTVVHLNADVDTALGGGLVSIVWAPLVASLSGSILEHLRAIGILNSVARELRGN